MTLGALLSPQELADAHTLAEQVLDGFNRHYAIFRECGRDAKTSFEQGDWVNIQKLVADRVAYYDARVAETVQTLAANAQVHPDNQVFWQEVKNHYVECLMNHQQPECAETFFNSVTTKVLKAEYFHNRFIFSRPIISTEFIDSASATYRSYYPIRDGWEAALTQMFEDYGLTRSFADLPRDVATIITHLRQLDHAMFDHPRPNLQIQVISSLFYRNKGAYILGKIINAFSEFPFVIPILHHGEGDDARLMADTIVLDNRHINSLFSFNRAYFMIDCDVPSAVVQFLHSILPSKPKGELYNMIGLQKQGKALFALDYKRHIRHSTDNFILAPGIRGLVMLVFTLPSFPYVFKIIKDVISPPKEVDKELVQQKYNLVKKHDRVGRMADSLEFSNVNFPRERMDAELIDEIIKLAPTEIVITDDEVIIKHVYIERRMIPLNIYLQDATDAGDINTKDNAVIEYGNALKDLIAANIFPGDLLFKNFGITRGGRVVFYDYDEIEYLTDCRFRPIPKARFDDDDTAGEVWFSVDKYDVFPEEFEKFLLTDPEVKEVFMRHHADLLDWRYWKQHQDRIRAGHIEDFYPYPQHLRFAESGYTHPPIAPAP